MVLQFSVHSDSWNAAQVDSVLRVSLLFPVFTDAQDSSSPHASGVLVTFLLSQTASLRSPPFSALHQPHPWQPGQEIQPSSSSLSQKLERFYAKFLMPLSLPKPKSPDLPCANSTRRSCLDTFRNDLEPLLNTQMTGSLPAHHTPTHMLLVESGSVLLVFFFSFSLFLPPFLMNPPHLSFPYYLSSGKLIRELKSQDKKGP